MRRRLFLGMIGGGLLLACGGCGGRYELKVLGLAGAVPTRTVGHFEQKFTKPDYKTENTPHALWQRLQNAENPSDVMSLGDSWLDWAIERQLIQPLTDHVSKIPQWQNLGRWQSVTQRGDQVWGIPYRWGFTGIIYRRDRVQGAITGWADLWRPDLARKIILPDDPSEVIGLVLKYLGANYHESNPLAIPAFGDQLQALQKQVLWYNSSNYLQPLIADDADVAVGWSVDLIRASRQYPNLRVVLPPEGTALWADVWVIPRSAKVKDASLQWINYTLDPQASAQITALTDAPSPIISAQVPASVRTDPWKFPDPHIIAKSEWLSDLPPALRRKHQEIWQQLRQGQAILKETTGKTMEIIGTIQRSDIGMGAWTLVTQQGSTYELMPPVDPRLLKVGQRVKIIGRERPDVMSMNIVGPILEVQSFTVLGN